MNTYEGQKLVQGWRTTEGQKLYGFQSGTKILEVEGGQKSGGRHFDEWRQSTGWRNTGTISMAEHVQDLDIRLVLNMMSIEAQFRKKKRGSQHILSMWFVVTAR